MSEVLAPTWSDLQRLVETATEQLLICTPYYTKEGVGRVFDHLSTGVALRIWTRLSPTDWASGVSDPEELLALLELVSDLGSTPELGIHQYLHAKAYVADRSMALIGSANLTGGGFSTNLELIVRFLGQEAEQAAIVVEALCRPRLRPCSAAQLRTWIEGSRAAVALARRSTVDDAEILSTAQASLDAMLGYGGPSLPALARPDISELDSFIVWLRAHNDLAGADVLLRRHDNADGQQLQGHVKQSFFACWRFLQERPGLQPILDRALSDLAMRFTSPVTPSYSTHGSLISTLTPRTPASPIVTLY
ncbi:MAG: phospholipase D-like domain-containing protein, partial [bacterium]